MARGIKRKLPVWGILLLVVLVLMTAVTTALIFLNEFTLELQLEGRQVITVEHGSQFTDPGASAQFYGSIFLRQPKSVEILTEGQVDTQQVGTYYLRYSAQYWKLSALRTRTVQVVDTTVPVLTLEGEGELVLEVGTAFQDPGAKALDSRDGDITGQIEVSGQVDAATLGTYQLLYTVRDKAGNQAFAQRDVTVVDTTAPVLALEGQDVGVYLGGSFQEPGFTASDNYDGDLTDKVTVEGSVDTGKLGKYTLTYTVSDSSGNVTTAQRTVHVVVDPYPGISLSGSSTVYLLVGETYTEPGYSAWDDTDGNLTSAVYVSSNVQTDKVGSYTVTYSVTNSLGYSTTARRTVVVLEANGGNGKVIYLTFDDGPGGYTDRLLDILDRYGVKVTFFVVGTGRRDTVARAAAAGHTIGLHTYTHDFSKVYASEEAYFADLYKIQAQVAEYTGQTSMLMRFPGGSSNTVSRSYNRGIMTRLTKLVEEKGFTYFDWNVDCNDAGGAKGMWDVYNNLVRGVSNRTASVVLCHDIKKMTVDAMEEFIPWALSQGYTFLPLDSNSPTCHHGLNN